MKAYIVPDWLTIIAGLVIYKRQPETKVLLGLRSAREAAGQWCLPTGKGAIRRDTSLAVAEAIRRDETINFAKSLEDPMSAVQIMSERQQQAFLSPAGFALAEARWYIALPPDIYSYIKVEALELVGQFDLKSVLVKIYYAMEWPGKELPRPATTGTEWPFDEVRWFTREEIKKVKVAFGCEEDLEKIFWPRFNK